MYVATAFPLPGNKMDFVFTSTPKYPQEWKWKVVSEEKSPNFASTEPIDSGNAINRQKSDKNTEMQRRKNRNVQIQSDSSLIGQDK